MGVKREDAVGNDPENGSPDADRGGTNCEILGNQIFPFNADRSISNIESRAERPSLKTNN